MGSCQFVEEKFSTHAVVKGATAFAEKENACFKDTGIYLPPDHSFSNDTVNVVLWLHGFYVHDARDLMHPENSDMDMKVRESVLASKKDVVFVAPWLGHKSSSTSGELGLGPLGQGDGGQAYLEAVLDGLARFQRTLSGGASASLQLGALAIAGHSAGGAQMREATKHLGKFKENLKECWGFDCFYDGLYPSWIRETPTPEKYFYVANGSGGGGLYAFNLMKDVYGTPRKPISSQRQIPNLYLAPAVDGIATARDDIAFQSIPDILDWSPAGPNVYNDVRKKTDPFLDDASHMRYWSELRGKLVGHFRVVKDLLGPRIRQSKWL
jgi:hypothetical protein